MNKTIEISGLKCPKCDAKMKAAFEALDAVEAAEVNHENGTAVLTLSADVEDAVLKTAVEDAGFTFVGIN